MSEWSSYRLQDFIPFTADAYYRLLERTGEDWWPLHLLALALGAGALFLMLFNRPRIACILMALPWAFVSVAFFAQRYAELSWAGHYVGRAFLVEAAILALVALTGRGTTGWPRGKSLPVLTGILIAAFGLLVYPVMAPLMGHSWYQAETFGIHPDPTAIATLGLVLIALRGAAMWATAVIPLLWITLSGLTLLVLGAPLAISLFTLLAAGVVGLIWKSNTPSFLR